MRSMQPDPCLAVSFIVARQLTGYGLDEPKWPAGCHAARMSQLRKSSLTPSQLRSPGVANPRTCQHFVVSPPLSLIGNANLSARFTLPPWLKVDESGLGTVPRRARSPRREPCLHRFCKIESDDEGRLVFTTCHRRVFLDHEKALPVRRDIVSAQRRHTQSGHARKYAVRLNATGRPGLSVFPTTCRGTAVRSPAASR